MTPKDNPNSVGCSPPPGNNGHGPSWRRFALLFCIIVFGVLVSMSLCKTIWENENDVIAAQFALDAGKRIEAIQTAVSDRLAMVNSVKAFFRGSQFVEKDEFRTFTRSFFKGHPGVLSLGWLPRVPESRLTAHQELVRGEQHEKYEVFQYDDLGQTIPVPKRSEYFPILFDEPVRENQSLIGFDLNSLSNFREAIRQGIETERRVAVVAAPLDHNERDTQLLYVLQPASNEHPAGRQETAGQPTIDGFILAVFRLSTIVENSLRFFPPAGIDIDVTGPSDHMTKISICSEMSPLHLQTESPDSQELAAPDDLGCQRVTGHLKIANLVFTINCVPLRTFSDPHRTWEPWIILVAGLIITSLVAGVFLLLSERTARIERLVAKRAIELSESEMRFRHLVDNAGDAFFLHKPDGKILDVNRRACERLGYTRDELLSMTLQDIDVDFVPENLGKYHHLPLERYPVTFRGVHRKRDGSTFPVEIRLSTMDVNGRRFMLGLARDITEQTRMVEQLRESERTMRAVLDQSFQFIGLLTTEGILTAANRTALAFSGISDAEVLNKPFWTTPWWSHSPALQEELRLAIQRAAKGDFVRMEVTHQAANGDLHWVDFSLKPVKDDSGDVLFLIPEGRDITDRKRAEDAIQREQRLLREMLDLHERERKIVAYEIHDGLAQQLTGAMFKLQSAELTLNRDPEMAKKLCAEGVHLLGEAMAETRRLIGGLRPPVLDESGIVAGVEYLIAEEQKHEGPEIEFVHDEEFERLAPPIESALYRIIQECLTNARRHSRSEKVRVELRQQDHRVVVNVRDWGIGFTSSQTPEGHFGLRGINERARLLGGTVAIDSAPGKGTQIQVELPLITQAENGNANKARATS